MFHVEHCHNLKEKIMFELFLTIVLNGQVSAKNHIDGVKFQTMAQCEAYKKRMNYIDSKMLKFTCERDQ